jgi:hypothetical protein
MPAARSSTLAKPSTRRGAFHASYDSLLPQILEESDEARYRLIAVGRAREEALELLADDLVEEGLLRVMALVLGHEAPFRDLRG